MRTAILVLVALATAMPQRARADDATQRARVAFERGRELYGAGRYEEAAREFEAGYALSPRPLFLVNLGQAYRQLGQLERARDQYRRFLEQSPPSDPQRSGVERIVADLDAKIAEQKRREAPPPAPAVVAAPPKKKPFIKRHWWIIPVGAVVVTGLAVGIYFAVHPPGKGVDCSGATLGCY